MKFILPLAIVVCALPARAQNPLVVRVLDESGQPVAGALVAAQTYEKDAPKTATQTTDASGQANFSLPNQADGKPTTATVTAGARGYSFSASSGANKSVEIRLTRGQIWRGKVVDEKGAPLANAQIVINGAMKFMDFGGAIFIESDAIKALYSAQSKADGTFEIAGLPANKQLFYRVSLPGFAPVKEQDGRVDKPETFKLVRSGALRGRALGIAGEPLAGVQVFATSRTTSSMEVSDEVKTDAEGAFTLSGLPPGDYELHGTLRDKMPFLLLNLKDVRVVAGQTATAGEWRAIKGVEIRGFVFDSLTKKPIENAIFSAQTKADEKSGSDSAWATSDATGHFVLHVLPGDYRVRVGGNAPGYLSAPTIRSAQPKAGAPAQVSFELQSAPIVRGITRDEKGAPLQAQLLVGTFGQPLETDAQGKWQYTPFNASAITFGGGEDDDGYFEIISPKRVDFPAKGPIVVTVRRHAWQQLAGRVVTPDGAPIEGATVKATFTVMTSDRNGRGAQSSALSDQDGRYVLRRLRDSRQPYVTNSEIKVSAKKDGYDFESGGKVTREGIEPRVSDLVLVPLSVKISGVTSAGADVVVAGRQTRADDAGRFSFESIPAGENRVYAAKGDLFGSAPASQSPLEIALSRPQAQPRDEVLAREVWANNVAAQTDQSTLDLDQWSQSSDFAGKLRVAQRSGNPWQIGAALGRLKPTDSPAAQAIARETLNEMAPSEARTGAFLEIALSSGDAALTDRALELANAQFEEQTKDSQSREAQLYQAAVLTERRDGAQAGALVLRRALAYTLRNHPEQSRVEGGYQTAVGRNETLGRIAAPIVAQGSPAMLRELLETIEPASGFAVMARLEAIPVIARVHGYKAAAPVLEELRQLPAPAAEGEMGYRGFDANWAYRQAIGDIIPIIGPTDAATALALADKVEGDDEQRGRALASAARFQSLAVAAPLLREAAEKIDVENAPRVAAYAYERDEKLGLELFEIARRHIETEMKDPINERNLWIGFAFSYARANPAQSRLILEREWASSLQKKIEADDLSLIARAMAPVDARRATEMARQLSAQSKNWATEAQIKIARYLVADEATRRDFVLDPNSPDAPWNAGELQW